MQSYQLISTSKMFLIISSILLTVAIIRFIISPYLKFQKLRKNIKGKYRFYEYPFRPFGFSFISKIIQDFRQHGDSFYSRKHELAEMDLAIGTLGNEPLLCIISRELIQEFAQRQKQGFYKKNGGMHNESFKQLLGTGLLFSESNEWRYKRKVMSSLFNYDFIKSKFSMIVAITKDTCLSAKTAQQNGERVLIEVNHLFKKIFGTILIRCFFGDIAIGLIQGKDPFQFLSNLTDKICERIPKISNYLFGKILIKYCVRKIDQEIDQEIKIFHQYVKKTINKILDHVQKNPTEKQTEGLIAKLLREKKLVKECSFQEKIAKGYYTYEDLVDQMCTFFFAGTDTTANLQSSLIFKLLKKKQIEEKLRKEIQEVLDDKLDNLSMENLKKMNYLRHVQAQILRIKPPATLTIVRQALADHLIGQIEVRKGTRVTIEILGHHFNPKIFDKPDQFIPQRWEKLQNDPNIASDFIPFNFGLRNCIGQQLALIQSKVALIVFLLNFKNGLEIEPPRYKFGLTYGPEKSLISFETY